MLKVRFLNFNSIISRSIIKLKTFIKTKIRKTITNYLNSANKKYKLTIYIKNIQKNSTIITIEIYSSNRVNLTNSYER